MPAASVPTNSGFSILEVPIALAILAVILVIYNGAAQSLLLNRNSRDADLARQIAVSELEDLRHLGYASLPPSGPFTHPLLTGLPQNLASLTVADYNADTKQVTATVSWQEPGSGIWHSESLTTLINKFGL